MSASAPPAEPVELEEEVPAEDAAGVPKPELDDKGLEGVRLPLPEPAGAVAASTLALEVPASGPPGEGGVVEGGVVIGEVGCRGGTSEAAVGLAEVKGKSGVCGRGAAVEGWSVLEAPSFASSSTSAVPASSATVGSVRGRNAARYLWC